MILLKFFTLCVIVHSSTSASVQTEEKDNAIFLRALRDTTGHYHPERNGDHSHEHRTELGNEIPTTLGVTYPPPPFGYSIPPPPPPVDYGGTPNGYANCGCVQKGRCPRDVQIDMVQLLRDLKNDVVCGITEYELCCLKDPWPGQMDIFKPQAACVPVEICTRKYGDRPTDVQDFGVIGPCLGLGSVRCLDDKPYHYPPPPEPISIVVPIVDYNPPPPVYIPPTAPPTTSPPVVYQPPTVYEPPTSPPVVYVPPTSPPVVYEPPTSPPVVYEPPTSPPVVYEPPTSPPVVYEPPTSPPVVYEPPVIPPTVYEPPVVYEPPTSPPVVYEPPAVTYEAPVTAYEPPTTYEAPVVVYEPPTTYEAPVVVYEPPTTYEAPVTTYEAPVATYEPPIPATTYGTPEISNDIGVSLPPKSRSSYLTRYPGYGGYRRYGFPYGGGYGYGYPHSGYGFRKRLSISKYFG